MWITQSARRRNRSYLLTLGDAGGGLERFWRGVDDLDERWATRELIVAGLGRGAKGDIKKARLCVKEDHFYPRVA